MNILVVGSGGREHAITRALHNSGDCEIYAAVSNLNPGITSLTNHHEKMDINDPDRVASYAEQNNIDIAIIGPESPLEAGVVDELEDRGIYGFGPRKAEARIETDKAWSRDFMKKNNIDGLPDYEVFHDSERAAEYIESYDGDVAVKPHGLTGGKGVKVTGDQITKEEAVDYVLNGDYDEFVIEERLVGEEFTLQAFVSDGELRTMPAVQDHKRAYRGDEGPNTGGMGSYTDSGRLLPFMIEGEHRSAVEIMNQTVKALPSYKGILYGQFMLTKDGPKVVEFNARFGDPEAMNVLPILETNFLDILRGARDGDLPSVSFRNKATVCKYAVPDGYPVDPDSGYEINISEDGLGDDALLFYASVEEREGSLFTTTSRSIAVVGIGDSIEEAERAADNALSHVGDGLRIRHDIGKPDLIQKRIDYMEKIRK